MKIRLLLTTIFAACTFTATMQAKPLSPEEALQRLEQSHAKAGIALAGNTSPAYTASLQGNATWYAINAPQGGFAIVSANDCAQPLLGYVPQGSFSYNALPTAMQWWLDCYSHEIAEAAGNEAKGAAIRRTDSRQAIVPMETTL